MEKFLSYAQELEDLILYNALSDVKNGFYIDVGANDPWDISVTKAFYERGFHGINIEPLDDKWESLKRDRERDINLCIGVGAEAGELVLYQMGSGSTFDREVYQKALDDGATASEKIVPVMTLSDRLYSRWSPPSPEQAFQAIRNGRISSLRMAMNSRLCMG